MAACSENCGNIPGAAPAETCVKCCPSSQKCQCDCHSNYGPDDLRRVWRVGTSTPYYPFEIFEDEMLKGFDIELIQMIGDELRYRVEFVDLDFDALLYGLNVKYIDAICAGMTPDGFAPNKQARDEYADFTEEYFRAKDVILTRNNFDPPLFINTLADLDGLTIGAQKDTTQLDLVQDLRSDLIALNPLYDMGIEDKVVSIPLLMEMLETSDFEHGPLHGIVMIQDVAEHYAGKYPTLAVAAIDLDSEDYCAIALPKESALRERINDLILKWKGDGTLDALIEFWFGGD